jgi:amino acid permease
MTLTQQQKNYYQAIAVLIGQIIGVGIFGLPYLASKTGALPLIFLVIVIGLIQYFVHLIYANIAIFTPTFHQLPGYTEIYLGRTGKNFVFVASLIGYYSALLAYLIVSGAFLYQLLSPTFGGSEFVYASLIFLVEAIIVFFGVHVLARVELIMTGLVMLVICLIAWKSFDFVNINNYFLLNWRYFLVPYGAVLFALDGKNVVPFVVELLAKDKVKIKKAIRWSIIIAGLITTCFALVVIGVSGDKTTPNALIGMKSVLHDGTILLSLIFGVLCIFTSFLGSAQSLRKTYNWDYKINKHLAWFFTLSIPYLLYIIGIDNFVKVISFAGAVAGGIISIALITIALKNNDDPNKLILFKKKLPDALHYLLIAMFTAGIFYEVFCFILK